MKKIFSKKLVDFSSNRTLWVLLAVLLLISFFMVFATVQRMNAGHISGIISDVFKHILHIFLCVAIVFGVSRIKYTQFSKWANWIMLVSIILLIFTMFFGKTINGATRTIQVLGFNLQSSEVAKVAIVNYICYRIAQYRVKTPYENKWHNLLSMYGPIVLVLLLVMPSNFSMGVIISFSVLAALVLGGLKFKNLVLLSGAMFILGLGYFGVTKILDNNEKAQGIVHNVADDRLDSFNFSEEKNDVIDFHDQQDMAKMAVATGGMFGKAPWNSEVNDYLPHCYSDYIFAIIVETTGVVGMIVILLIYLCILICCLFIMHKDPLAYRGLVVGTLGMMIVFQAFTHIMVNVGVLPVTGQPLPLISWGGSSMIMTGVVFGMIISINRSFDKK